MDGLKRVGADLEKRFQEKRTDSSDCAGWQAEVDAISPAEWERQWQRFADASLYHTWAYGAVSWGEGNLSHLVLKKAGEVAAMAQVRIVKVPGLGGIAYVRWAPLFRLNGGWEMETFRAALEALKSEYAVKRGLLLRIIPNIYSSDEPVKEAADILGSCGFEQGEQRRYQTMRVDLSQSIEDLRKGLKQRWRNKLKHAEADGFAVSMGTSKDFYDRFHRAYDEMMARKRFETTVDVKEFARLQAALPASSKMQILLAEKDGILFNALVLGIGVDTAVYVLAATSNEGLKADGAFLLQWRAINYLKERGCRWYDLGGANKEWNPGVYQFKSGMGGIDSQQLGVFEFCANAGRKKAIRLAESGVVRLKKWKAKLGARSSEGSGSGGAGTVGKEEGATAGTV